MGVASDITNKTVYQMHNVLSVLANGCLSFKATSSTVNIDDHEHCTCNAKKASTKVYDTIDSMIITQRVACIVVLI
jgi:hypothetical protein